MLPSRILGLENDFEKGIQLLKSGQFEEALKAFTSVIEKNPNAGEAYNNRGTAYANLGQFQRAIQDYDEAIRLNPQYGKAYAMRALAHTHLNMDVEAQQDFDRAVRLGYDPSLLQAEIEKLKKQRQR